MQHLVRPGGVFGAGFMMPAKRRPHVGQPYDRTHRMGLLLAARTSTSTDHF